MVLVSRFPISNYISVALYCMKLQLLLKWTGKTQGNRYNITARIGNPAKNTVAVVM